MVRSPNLADSRFETPKTGGGAAGIAAGTSVGAVAVGACCAGPLAGVLGPLLVTLLGPAGAAAVVRVAPLVPYLFAAAFLLLAYGFWINYRPRAYCATNAGGSATRRLQFSRLMLWLASAIFVVSVAYSGLVLAGRL